jgi:hypothetical protein
MRTLSADERVEYQGSETDDYHWPPWPTHSVEHCETEVEGRRKLVLQSRDRKELTSIWIDRRAGRIYTLGRRQKPSELKTEIS